MASGEMLEQVTPALQVFPSLGRNRNFLLLGVAYVVSALGDRIHFLVMLKLISVLSGRRLHIPGYEAGVQETAQLTIMMLLPFLLVSPIMGMFADRWPRRRIMVISDLARVVIVIAARTLFLRNSAVFDDALLYAILLGSEFIIAIFGAAFSPARSALMPELVHPDQLLRANSMMNAAGTIASLIGFVIGAALIKWDLNGAMYTDAGTFVFSACCLMGMKLVGSQIVPLQKAGASESFHPVKSFVDGVSFIRQHKRALQVMLLMLLFWACGGIILDGLTGVITKKFGLSIEAYGYFMGAVGFGMVIGAAVVSLARDGIPKEIGISWSLTGVGVALFCFSFMHGWKSGLVFLILAAMFGAILLVSLETLLQRIVPNYVRGRVMGVKEILATGGLVSVSVPLAVWQSSWGDLDGVIMIVLRCLAVFVIIVGAWLTSVYYRAERLPVMVAILRRISSAYLRVWKGFRVGNAARIPIAGPVILVANHTTAFDPLVLQSSSKFRLVQFMMAREFYELRGFQWIYKWLRVIPVNRTGNDTASVRATLRALKDGACIGMFPEGKISLDGKLAEGKAGVALLALMSGATVVPVYIQGTNLYAGMVKDFVGRGKVTAYFGTPLTFEEFAGKGRDEEVRDAVTQRIMIGIASIRDRYETNPTRLAGSSGDGRSEEPTMGQVLLK